MASHAQPVWVSSLSPQPTASWRVDRAIAMAKELAEIPADEDVEIVHYPKKKDLFEMITSGAGPKAAVSWIMYRYIREDLSRSLELLSNGSLSYDHHLAE